MSTYTLFGTSSNSQAQRPLSAIGIVETAIRRTYNTIFSQNFVPWKFHPRNSPFEPSPDASSRITITTVALIQTALDQTVPKLSVGGSINESYTLQVTAKGKATITAPSSLGIAHGLTTFTQLFFAHSSGSIYTDLAPVKIQDAPKFSHRGLNLDVSRSFYAVADILRTIDALAYNKFNILHLHITDSQSWPLEIPSMPNLAAKGAYRAGLSYSPADLRKIQLYGSLVGVEVNLEIDMPGHTSAIYFGYPDLIAAFNMQSNWESYAAEPPSGTLKLNSSAVYQFLDTLWDDLLPRVSPYSSYFHTGGDEVDYNAYTLDETVLSSDPAVIDPLMQKLANYNHARIRAAGLTPMVWEEMVLSYGLTLGSDVVIQCWLSEQSVAEVVSLGYRAIGGNYNYWYMDCGEGMFT